MDNLTIEQDILDEAVGHLQTIRDFIRFGVTALRSYEVHLGQGTEDFFAESSALVLQSLSLEWSADEQILDAKLLPSEKQRITQLLEKRINQRIPLGYLLNLAYFAGQPYYVDERVLIPRSPVAELIENQFNPYFSNGLDKAQGGVNQLPHNAHPFEPTRMLDLCTGSGCIAIALAYAFPDATIDAIDISRDALEVAAINVEHHHREDQVSLIESNLLEKIPAQRQYDLIISNPPYVDSADMADLPEEFLHEPELALAAGRDGLDLVRHILAQAADYLTDNGLLVVEVGNSEWALQQAFPKIKFHWLHFNRGGAGVFALTAQECRQYQAEFKAALA
ncbi:50S ribosomal protein L3 N(5)-glutamine methyltransferase [Alkanindiges sp. WGS2144]|uniref:50S ribosomal protein L3 N(5)-glutamine methyltransferase n=1 Tax=Alkanindiges sp. WGS2144 TaxID=3366808 RepID=UPI00375086C0